MTLRREFRPPALSKGLGDSVLTPNPTGSDFISTAGGVFDIIHGDMGSLCLQTTLLERINYAGDGMGVGSYCAKEVA